MQIDPTSPKLTLRLPSTGALPPLRLGAELAAQVLRADPSRILLQIGGATVEARSALSLQSGQQLRLQVAQLQPTVVLRLTQDTAQSSRQTVDSALRRLLPQAGARAPLTDALARLAGQDPAPLPGPARQALGTLLARLPQASTLTRPEGLARALGNSGLFLEARLGTGTLPPAGDLKAALLQVLQAVRPAAGTKAARTAATANADPELLKVGEATEAALARLQLLQLHAATSPRLDLFVELPVMLGAAMELLEFRIEADEHAGGGDEEPDTPREPAHQVRLGFGFGESGRLDALVRLRGDTVSVLWWAERPQTAALLRDLLPQLAQRLQALGLQLEELDCLDGRPRTADSLPILRRGGVLRERA